MDKYTDSVKPITYISSHLCDCTYKLCGKHYKIIKRFICKFSLRQEGFQWPNYKEIDRLS